ncbi:hypothetical protein AYI70_g7867, partial [Smittium culicis]
MAYLKNMDRRPHQGTDEGPDGHLGDRECPVDQKFLLSRFKRKPIKRARSLFSDIVKGDDPEYANKAELTSTNVNSASVIDKSKSDTQYLNQKTPKKNTNPTKYTKKR